MLLKLGRFRHHHRRYFFDSFNLISVFSPLVEYCGQKRCTAAEQSRANLFAGSRLVANQQQPFMEKTSNANNFLTCPDIDSLPSSWRADLQLIPHNDTGQREWKAEANWDQRGQGFFFFFCRDQSKIIISKLSAVARSPGSNSSGQGVGSEFIWIKQLKMSLMRHLRLALVHFSGDKRRKSCLLAY